jgi:enamine deaminase RidA (YjgF/YER057c/UK114 family)
MSRQRISSGSTFEEQIGYSRAVVDGVVRVHYILPDREDFEPCWPVLRKWFGEARPAATMLSCGLADPAMKIEIE